MKNVELKKLCKQAVNANVIVYDDKALPGVLTPKLIQYIAELSKDHNYGIHTIYVPNCKNGKTAYNTVFMTKAKKYKFYIDEHTQYTYILPYCLDYCKGILPKDKINLVLAVGKDNRPLLAAY